MMTKITCRLLLALALNALAGSAFAYDTKVFSGTPCNPVSGSQADTFTTWWDYIYNGDTGYASVACPIVRDRAYNANGIDFAYAYVRSSGGQTLTCTLYSYDTAGGFVASNSASTTSNSVTSLLLNINASAAGGTYAIYCSLPSGGRVYGYRVAEFEPTDGIN